MKLLVLGFDGLSYHKLIEHLKTHPDTFFNTLPHTLHKCTPTKTITKVGWYELLTGANYYDAPHQPYLWITLEKRYKYSSGVYLIPYTFPASKVNGWMLSGYPAKDMERAYYPRTLRSHIRIPRDIIEYRKVNTLKRVKKANGEVVYNQLQELYKLTARHPVDALFTQFSFPDHIQHMIGWQKDKSHYDDMHEYIQKKAGEVAMHLYNHYQPEAFVVVSDHGSPCSTDHRDDGVAYFMRGSKDVNDLRSVDVKPIVLGLFGDKCFKLSTHTRGRLP